MDLSRLNLNQVEEMYRQGRISESDTLAYIEAWNTKCFRYTYAYLRDGGIRQRIIEDD